MQPLHENCTPRNVGIQMLSSNWCWYVSFQTLVNVLYAVIHFRSLYKFQWCRVPWYETLPVIFEIARVPVYCERSKNNTITFAHLSHMITEFAARNVAFTLKKYICCSYVVTNFQNNTHIFEIGAKIAVPLNRLQTRWKRHNNFWRI